MQYCLDFLSLRTRHLNKGVPQKALNSYFSAIRKWVPSEPVIHIDDSDVVKPDGHKFEALGPVRDGSKNTDQKNVYGFSNANYGNSSHFSANIGNKGRIFPYSLYKLTSDALYFYFVSFLFCRTLFYAFCPSFFSFPLALVSKPGLNA